MRGGQHLERAGELVAVSVEAEVRRRIERAAAGTREHRNPVRSAVMTAGHVSLEATAPIECHDIVRAVAVEITCGDADGAQSGLIDGRGTERAAARIEMNGEKPFRRVAGVPDLGAAHHSEVRPAILVEICRDDAPWPFCGPEIIRRKRGVSLVEQHEHPEAVPADHHQIRLPILVEIADGGGGRPRSDRRRTFGSKGEVAVPREHANGLRLFTGRDVLPAVTVEIRREDKRHVVTGGD